MKNPDNNSVSQLEQLPNIGNAIAKKLRLIGIKHPKQLIGKDPFELYDTLCISSGKRNDPCIIDVFMSVIHFMEKGTAKPWWEFTEKRKKQLTQKK